VQVEDTDFLPIDLVLRLTLIDPSSYNAHDPSGIVPDFDSWSY
jgi:hypothetical protein